MEKIFKIKELPENLEQRQSELSAFFNEIDPKIGLSWIDLNQQKAGDTARIRISYENEEVFEILSDKEMFPLWELIEIVNEEE